MRSTNRLIPAGLLMLCLPVAAMAQMPAPAPCAAVVAPGAAFAAWAAPVDRPAAGNGALLPSADIAVGQALKLALMPQGKAEFALQPGKPGAAGSHAGLLSLTIIQPGTYRVALGVDRRAKGALTHI